MAFVQDKTLHENPGNFGYILPYKKLTDVAINGVYQFSDERYCGYHEETFYGERINDFHMKKSRGDLLPFTRYSRVSAKSQISGPEHLSAGFSGFNVTVKWQDGTTGSHGDRMDPVESNRRYVAEQELALVGLDESNRNEFVQAAASKLYSRGWDALTFVSELHHVVRMFRNAGSKFMSLLDDFDNTAMNVKPVNEWLEARYGWRILLKDIEDINELMSNFDKKQLYRSKDRVGTKAIKTYHWEIPGTGDHAVTFDHKVDIDMQVRGSIIADFMPSRFTLNPVLTGWEVITLSFVIDWFFTVGRAIEAISFLNFQSNYSSGVGWSFQTRREVTAEVAFFGQWAANNPYSNWGDIHEVYTDEVLVREPIPVPFLPSWNVNLNGFKVLDLVALIMQYVQRIF